MSTDPLNLHAGYSTYHREHISSNDGEYIRALRRTALALDILGGMCVGASAGILSGATISALTHDVHGRHINIYIGMMIGGVIGSFIGAVGGYTLLDEEPSSDG